MSLAIPEAIRATTLPVNGSDQLFPINRMFCVGRNYYWDDSSEALREPPLYFMKPASSVIEARGEIAFPPRTEEFCHEIELVVAIGKGGLNIPVSQALQHVWGYAAGLDLTRRDLQMAVKAAGQPWEAAKVFDGSAPISPIVPASQCGHPSSGAIWLSVNGVQRQRSDLARQMWSVPEIISEISSYITLKPGDLIMTGTPPGVAALQPGDQIHAAIDGISSFEVRVGPKPNTSTHNAHQE